MVENALARDHEVTLFNRGQTNPELFPEAERLRGDRDGDLSALEGREWDAVVDTSGFVPRVVRQSVELLGDCVGHYAFVSSGSVYADPSRTLDESSPVHSGEPESEDVMEHYGELKAACERVVLDAFGDRALVVRAGLIVGPHDPTGRFSYWPHRIARGGDVLAPEPRDKRVQFIDVRDLADWMVRMAESRGGGVFNAAGAERPTMEELLEGCRRAVNPDARLAWVDAGFLLEQRAGEWMELPLWIVDPEYAGFLDADVSKAVAAGLTFRPLEDTIRSALSDAETTDDAGMKPEREAELLAAWHTIAT